MRYLIRTDLDQNITTHLTRRLMSYRRGTRYLITLINVWRFTDPPTPYFFK
jgi:hypothetical protein